MFDLLRIRASCSERCASFMILSARNRQTRESNLYRLDRVWDKKFFFFSSTSCWSVEVDESETGNAQCTDGDEMTMREVMTFMSCTVKRFIELLGGLF